MALSQTDLIILLFEHDYDHEQCQRVLGEIIKYYQEACKDHAPERVDQLLDAIDADCVTSTYLGGLLRFSVNFAAGNLNNWYDFRERSVQAITRRGEDPNDALYGLLDENILEKHVSSDLFGSLTGLQIK